MKKSAKSTYLFFLLQSALLTAGVNQPDSIPSYNISEVVFEYSRSSFYHEEKRISSPDSITRKAFFSSSLGELIGLFTPGYINTTGSSGASSSLFLRGTNSYQATVSWNGFTLNSLTLGTMDLSLIPAAAVQHISVVHGASGSLAGSGNFGGSVLLDNRADWNSRLRIGVNSELGTFANRYNSLSSSIGNHTLQYQLHLFSHQAANNFSFTDIYKQDEPEEEIVNNALSNLGIMQNLYIRLPGSQKIEAGIWYQVKDKEIPAIMGSYLPSNATQSDSSLRVYARWSKLWKSSSLTFKSAFFDEHMRYRDKITPADSHFSVDSEIKSTRWLNDINYRIYLPEILSVDGGLVFSALSADAASYGKKTDEYQLAAITAAKLTLPGFVLNASLRKEFHSHTRIPLLFSVGARKDLPFRGMALKASYSDQFRVPSFNDKYWQPGGNPDLLPESGHTAEIGVVQNILADRLMKLVIEIGAYHSSVNNLIQWVPSETNVWWIPENRKEVAIRGLETSFSANGRTGRSHFTLGGCYNFASSLISRTYNENDPAEGKRLVYVPAHSGSAYLNTWHKNLFFGITGRFNGSRYTTADNNPLYKMPYFMIFNSYAGYNIRTGELQGRLQLRIMNLFNAQYQVTRSYPMPGRTFHLGFSVEFDKR